MLAAAIIGWDNMMKKLNDGKAVTTAVERADLYFTANPSSPSALRHPRLTIRSGVWVALLGNSISEGIAGFGLTVEAALRAFDVQYYNTLQLRNA